MLTPKMLIMGALALGGAALVVRKLTSKAPVAPPVIRAKTGPPKTAAAAAAAAGAPTWGWGAGAILGLAKDVGTAWVASRSGNAPSQNLSQASLAPSSSLLKAFT